jgi:acyl-CoA synthetase (AMP-forming)/AMP-acid ligase II
MTFAVPRPEFVVLAFGNIGTTEGPRQSKQQNRCEETCPIRSMPFRPCVRKGSAHAPKHIKFVTELPMTGVGKVDKKVLKAGFWAGRDRMVG